jgi:hypothetical protein
MSKSSDNPPLTAGELTPEDDHKKKKHKNDIKPLTSTKQLDTLDLDLTSPRFIEACSNLGVAINECQKK